MATASTVTDHIPTNHADHADHADLSVLASVASVTPSIAPGRPLANPLPPTKPIRRCQLCSYSATRPNDITKHLAGKAHMDTYPGWRGPAFPCPEAGCERRFAQRSALKRHSHTHLPKRRFFCGNCSTAYTRKDNARVCKCSSRQARRMILLRACTAVASLGLGLG